MAISQDLLYALDRFRNMGQSTLNELVRIANVETDVELIAFVRELGEMSPKFVANARRIPYYASAAQKPINDWIEMLTKQGLHPDIKLLKTAANSIGQVMIDGRFEWAVRDYEQVPDDALIYTVEVNGEELTGIRYIHFQDGCIVLGFWAGHRRKFKNVRFVLTADEI